jgi:hypothetical protein
LAIEKIPYPVFNQRFKTPGLRPGALLFTPTNMDDSYLPAGDHWENCGCTLNEQGLDVPTHKEKHADYLFLNPADIFQ